MRYAVVGLLLVLCGGGAAADGPAPAGLVRRFTNESVVSFRRETRSGNPWMRPAERQVSVFGDGTALYRFEAPPQPARFRRMQITRESVTAVVRAIDTAGLPPGELARTRYQLDIRRLDCSTSRIDIYIAFKGAAASRYGGGCIATSKPLRALMARVDRLLDVDRRLEESARLDPPLGGERFAPGDLSGFLNGETLVARLAIGMPGSSTTLVFGDGLVFHEQEMFDDITSVRKGVVPAAAVRALLGAVRELDARPGLAKPSQSTCIDAGGAVIVLLTGHYHRQFPIQYDCLGTPQPVDAEVTAIESTLAR